MKRKLYIIIAMLLPTLAAAQTVQVPYSCGAGKAFTIKVPVKLRGKSVEYVWYRNDTVVSETPWTAGVTTIAYTIPAEKAFGSSVAYHFKFRLNDGCADCWDSSPRYVVSFLVCKGVSDAGMVSSCSGVSDAGTVSFCKGVSDAGTVSFCSGVSDAGMVSFCNGVSDAGTISYNDDEQIN